MIAIAFLACWLLNRGTNAREATETGDLELQLQVAKSANLLMQQQLDEMFSLTTAIAQEQPELSNSQLTLFDSWLRFDEHFLNRIRRGPSSQFAQANVHCRRGLTHNILDQHEQALVEFHAAIDLLENLRGDHPAIASYEVELLRAHVYAARSAGKIGWPNAKILQHVDAALSLLSSPNLPETNGFQQLEVKLKQDSASLREVAE